MPNYRNQHKPWSDDENDRLTDMMGRGLSYEEIDATMPGRSRMAIRKQACKLGLKLQKPPQKTRFNLPREAPAPRPMTGLDHAVDVLRARYTPVCAEATIRGKVPKPYTSATLFRVGSRPNVTAQEVLEMARRAA